MYFGYNIYNNSNNNNNNNNNNNIEPRSIGAILCIKVFDLEFIL